MSMYGCEFWLLSNDYLNDLCASWRKSLRRIWGLPLNSHNYLLPLISRCLPLADEICSRSLNFINACLRNSSRLVRNIAHYGIHYGRYYSLIGHNALFCSRRYNFSFQDVSDGNVNVRRCVYNYVNGLIQNRQMQTANIASYTRIVKLKRRRVGTIEQSSPHIR